MPVTINGSTGITFPDGTTQSDGLPTPVPVADGGTGLTSPGANGNVLTSNGTSWVSSALPPSGFTGGTNVTSASNVTLTASSTQVQRVSMTAENLRVILPNATTCTKGGVIFSIVNNGVNAFNITDSTGLIYGTLNPSQAASYFLADNSTAGGVWTTVTAENFFFSSVPQDAPTSVSSVTLLSNTTGVYVYQRYTTVFIVSAVPFTVDPATGVFTFGSSVDLFNTNNASFNATVASVQKAADNSFFVAFSYYVGNSYSIVAAIAGTITNNVISVGSVQTLKNPGSASLYAGVQYNLRLSDSNFFVGYNQYNANNDTYINWYRMVTVSGNSVSLGGENTWVSARRTVTGATAVGSTQAVLTYVNPASSGTRGVLLATFSGSSITGFTATDNTTVPDGNFDNAYLYSPSAGTVIAVNSFAQSSNRTALTITYSGTTLSNVTAATFNAGNAGNPVAGRGTRLITTFPGYAVISSTSRIFSVSGPTSVTPLGLPSPSFAPESNFFIAPNGLIAMTNGSQLYLMKGLV